MSDTDPSDMTDDELRRVVAECVGWEWDDVFECWHQPNGLGATDEPPDYLNDDGAAWRLLERMPETDGPIVHPGSVKLPSASDRQRNAKVWPSRDVSKARPFAKQPPISHSGA